MTFDANRLLPGELCAEQDTCDNVATYRALSGHGMYAFCDTHGPTPYAKACDFPETAHPGFPCRHPLTNVVP